MELIRQLQEQCKEKDAQLKKAAEDMKFYKLELINREQSYNKVFGSKPVIGVFNPLENKVSADMYHRESVGRKGRGLHAAEGRHRREEEEAQIGSVREICHSF